MILYEHVVSNPIFSSPDPKCQLSYCHHFYIRRRLSVNFSLFDLLLQHHWASWNQTWQGMILYQSY